MATMYTVVWGDTLTSIAKRYNTTVSKLVQLNHIKNPDYIVVGQVLQVDGTATTPTKTTTNKVRIDVWGLVSGMGREMFVGWSCDLKNVDHYLVKWRYCIEVNGKEKVCETEPSQSKVLYASYTPPFEEATRVQVAVKPVAKTREVSGKDTPYFTGAWAWSSTHVYGNDPPQAPANAPGVSNEALTLTAVYDNLDAKALNATHIHFAVYQDNSTQIYRQATAAIDALGRASAAVTVAPGSTYKVRARAKKGKKYSNWTDYTDGYGTIPAPVAKFTKCEGKTETSAFLEWEAAKGAKTYDIQYATDRSYFSGSDAVTDVTGIESTSYEKTGLASGVEYFFRIRAVNDEGETGWSEISSVVLGTAPEPPTTWSSTTIAMVGEPLTLFWVHNSSDNSKQSRYELEIIIGDVSTTYKNETPGKEDKTYQFEVPNTSSYTEGTKIKWRVRTAGATGLLGNLLNPDDKNTFSEWSAYRTIDVYARPGVELSLSNASGAILDTLTQLPLRVKATTYPSTQKPIGYHVEILVDQNEDMTYEITDEVGNTKIIGPGDRVYSGYFDTSEPLDETLSANDMSLENGIKYKVICVASMDSSLTAEATEEFEVSWTDEQYEPNAEIIIDTDYLCTYVAPYCTDADGNLIEGVTLSVYRRDFDGGFTKINDDDLPNSRTYVVDPHPALDYARYRIVAKFAETGAISYCDIPGQPMGEKAIVLQWDETWREFDGIEGMEDDIGIPPMSGSMIKLYYNIDVSEDASPDVELVEYIGRSHPVAYYGTHKGESASWSATIPKSDTATLSALRHLQTWGGNVYAREPSGTGYWANVSVSFGQKHAELTIPVTISLKRVDGGV